MSFSRISFIFVLGTALLCGNVLGETITFDFDDDLSPLANGQLAVAPNAFGSVFAITSSGPNLGAAVFDSNPFGPNANSLDQDLLVDSTNILILQDTSQPGMGGNIFSVPNDSNEGGAINFDFSVAGFPVSLTSIDVIDIDDNNLMNFTLTDTGGLTRTVGVPSGYTGDVRFGEPGIATIDFTGGPQESPNIAGLMTSIAMEAGFNINNVASLDVSFIGSGALDNLVYVPEPATGLLLCMAVAVVARRRR